MIGRTRTDVEKKTVTVVLPEGWTVYVEHANDVKDPLLNVMGITSHSCLVRTPTAPIPPRK